MSIHPNAILLLRLKPDGLARKTFREIVADNGAGIDEDGGTSLKIGDEDYHLDVAETSYVADTQIAAEAGDIIVYNMVTYGYGEVIEWSKLEEQKKALQEWADGVCKKHNCAASFYVTANYW